METVKEPPLHKSSVDNLKITVTLNDESVEKDVKETDLCHQSNGVAESVPEQGPVLEQKAKDIEIKSTKNTNSSKFVNAKTDSDTKEPAAPSSSECDTTLDQTVTSRTEIENVQTHEEVKSSVVVDENIQPEKNKVESSVITTTTESLDDTMVELETECVVDRVTFQTEIVVESNDNDITETMCEETKTEEQDANNILSELGESIEFSEALRSSDVADNLENNNCAGRQAVFNKEELLDILQGNDDHQSGHLLPNNYQGNDDHQSGHLLPNNYQTLRGMKILETQMALQQLSRLKKKDKKRKSEKKVSVAETKSNKIPIPEIKPEESVVKNIVQDWDDDEERDEKCKVEPGGSGTCDEVENLSSSVDKVQGESNRTSVDSQSADGKSLSCNKSGDESQPQRRLGRVIKKKVIFDPDNPDTFTKTKAVKSKEQAQEKEQTPVKKVKTDPNQRAQSKSPLSKLQWKKPSPKNIKQNKRLTEIDKLLMDEGAVNMIYQLTPEAPKGKKNMRTKAEFIKKIQSSTKPDTKEMKFRERKKESKYEEGEPRKILGGKHRPSLNSSVKSPSVSEDFEAHSADDSIIYRRHSSSSYSSSCMSPRRLSDVEMTAQVTRNTQQVPSQISNDTNNFSPAVDNVTFMSDSPEVTMNETIDKNDCLSIKRKLNSKLNLALNKRKRENSKGEKPLKQKKLMKINENLKTTTANFKYVSLRFDGQLAVLCVQKPGTISNVEAIKEVEYALKLIESRKDISVTLFMPECGGTYSDLDLTPLLDDDEEIRMSQAYEIAESIRSLLHTVQKHSKLICAGVNSRCTGVGMALIGLSDVALASERASFAIAAKSHGPGPVEPGMSVVTSYLNLPQPLLNELVVFGRRVSASEALRNGLVSRVMWPEKFNEQVLNIAADIAAQPAHNIWMKKQMLNLKKNSSESTFLKCLEKERDLFIEYWTSDEGQQLLRTVHHAAPAVP